MTILTAYDAAVPPTDPPQVDIACLYGAGGDPDHVWTPAEITAQTARYRLPIFVQSNPGPATHTVDADTFVTWLRSIDCPPGSAIMLDLEEGITPTYVAGFGAILHAAGYPVLPYGPRSTLFANPVLDGYFVAWPGAPGIPAGCVAVQYADDVDNGSYDLSWVTSAVPLWDTRPDPAPVGPPPTPIFVAKPTTGRFGTLNAPVVAICPMPTGKGYTEVGADGGTFNYGTAPMLGSLAGKPLNAPIVDAVHTADGKGLVLLGTDGGVFTLGDASFEGSEGGKSMNAPAVSIRLTPSGAGYWIAGADGGVFAFGDAGFFGSAA